MTTNKYKKVLFFMVLVALCLVPFLYFLSDPRPQSVKEVEYEFGLHLSDEVKRVREIYKEPDFHGDGEAGILFSAGPKDFEKIKKDLVNDEVKKGSKEVQAIETCIKALEDRGFSPGLKTYSKVYYKQTSDYAYANFIGLILDEESHQFLFVRWDS